jgi:hypothetical protein
MLNVLLEYGCESLSPRLHVEIIACTLPKRCFLPTKNRVSKATKEISCFRDFDSAPTSFVGYQKVPKLLPPEMEP